MEELPDAGTLLLLLLSELELSISGYIDDGFIIDVGVSQMARVSQNC